MIRILEGILFLIFVKLFGPVFARLLAAPMSFGWWLSLRLEPVGTDLEPVDYPLSEEEAEELLKTPPEAAFWRCMRRSYTLAAGMQTVGILLPIALISLIVNQTRAEPLSTTEWACVGSLALILELLELPVLVAACKGQRRFRAWEKIPESIQPDYENVLAMGRRYAEYINHDRRQNKAFRCRLMAVALTVFLVILGLVGILRYRYFNVPRSLGFDRYQLAGYKYRLQKDGTVRIDDYYRTASKRVEIPATLSGAGVVELGAAFSGQKRLREVTRCRRVLNGSMMLRFQAVRSWKPFICPVP